MQRFRGAILCALAIASLCASWSARTHARQRDGNAAAPSTAQRAATYSAEISATEAHFSFAIGDHSKWAWYEAATKDNAMEYQWTVEVESEGHTYQFGFLLFKLGNRPPADGDTAALLRAGQTSVAIRVGSGMKVVPDGRLRVISDRDRIEIIVADPATMQLLFSGHPQVALFRMMFPGQAPVVQKANIDYT